MRVSKNLQSLLKSVDAKEKDKNVSDYGLRFISDLYYSISQDSTKNIHKASKTFKPSSMKCPRNMQYQVMGVEPAEDKISPELVGILESGTDRHIRLQQAIMNMKKNGIDCEYIDVADFVEQRGLTDLEIKSRSGIETKLYNKRWNISFMCDGLIKYLDRYFILEIKTETTRKNYSRTTMAEEHLPQVCAYYLSFNIPDIMMLYENRDNCTKKAYSVVVTEKQKIIEVVNKINTVNECIANNTLAPCNLDACKYCRYIKKCKGDGQK